LSNSNTDSPQQYRFGDWRFNPGSGDLSDGESTTRLEPKVAKLLAFFLVNQGRVISRDELIVEVWENRIVSDDAINRCISILRNTLSPTDRSAHIETVVRRGFISHFPPPPATQQVTSKAKAPRSKSVPIYAALTVAAVFVLYIAASRFLFSPPADPEPPLDHSPVVAVLPFTSSGFADDSEFFADGMHDDLLTQLAQLESLRVISRTSVQDYRGSSLNVREIGRELGADAILEGGIQAIDEQIRINVQLIDASTDEHLWAQRYDRELLPANIFQIQAEIARAIATAMQTTLTEQDAQQLAVLPTTNMAAYRAYHHAMEIRDSGGVFDPDYVGSLEEAVALDPGFDRAWAELVGILSLQNFREQDDESIRRIENILEQMQVRSPESANNLIAQTYYTYYILRDYAKAFRLISQVQELRPSDARVLELKSFIQRRLGDFEGRLDSIRLARSLDPRNLMWTVVLSRNLVFAHRYDEARHEIENSITRNLELATLNSFIGLAEVRDISQWPKILAALQVEFETKAPPFALWDAHIAAREFDLAEQYVTAIRSGSDLDVYAPAVSKLSGFDVSGIITYWFTHDSDRLDPLLIETRASLEESRNSEGDFDSVNHYLVLALLSAAEGDRAETERLVRVWRRLAVEDLAGLFMHLHFACRTLGMAGSTAAVECIRSGLAEPSLVAPFYEPFLPYYDSIREDPEFVKLLTELAPAG